MKTIVLFLLTVLCTIPLSSQVFDVVWETDRTMKTPESVWYDAGRDQIYVSNINGKPLDKDGNGFIALLARDGSIKKLEWVTGMHAPKGMVVTGNLLYVTDIDRIHAIDIEKAEIVKTMNVEGAKFLNDMIADDMGNIYVSDMANNRLLRIVDDAVEVWLEGEQLEGVNGLAFHHSLFAGNQNQLLKLDTETKSIKVFIDNTGPIDGLVPLQGNKFVISDWSGRIQMISQLEMFVLGNSTENNIQAADLGYIPDDNLILIPTFFDNRVVARKLP